MIRPGLCAEAALLVACARVEADGREAGQIRRAVEARPDWGLVLELARAHGMRPLLSHHLHAVCPEAVPRGILEQLRGFVRLNAARNLALARELLTLLSAFAAVGVRAVPYKGPVLAAATYGSLALREFTDLDVLVRPDEAVRARAVMIDRGYRPQYSLARRHDALFRRHYCEYLFTHPSTGTIVEVQWDIAPRFFSLAFDPETLGRRLGTASLLGTAVPALSPEDLLFILCVHGCKHAWSRLEWLCGVTEVVRVHPGLDWSLVLGLGARAGALRMVLVSLVLARDLLGAALPPAVSRAVAADPAVAPLAGAIASAMFGEDRPRREALSRAALHMRLRERWSDRIRYAVRLSSTPSARDWALLSGAPASRLAAYPVRAIRLALKHARPGH
jgi:hypothetical protein